MFGVTLRPTTPKLSSAILFAVVLVAVHSAQAQTFTVMHYFTTGADGDGPYAGLTMAGDGNFYGTTLLGGSGGYCDTLPGCGTVFKLSHARSGWVLSTLYSFTGDADGAGPAARVVLGPDGSLYGTTEAGGDGTCFNGFLSGCGTVFKLTPPAKPCTRIVCPWTKTVLYLFTGGSDGGQPGTGDLIFDRAGNIYGTTVCGGMHNGCCTPMTGCGVIYKLTHSNGGWTESVLYTFGGGTDGADPVGGPVFDKAENLYGTTEQGGDPTCNPPYGCGTVYALTPSGSGWTESVIHTFQSGEGGASVAGFIFDTSGNLLGTTAYLGANRGGTAFELKAGSGSWSFTLDYSFKNTIDDCVGWPGPQAPLVMDAAGNLYGTTLCDGPYGEGSAFKLTRSGENWTYTSLHDFGEDGAAFPYSNLILDANGHLYGTASTGGEYGGGEVFEITP